MRGSDMTNEVEDDADPLRELGIDFSAGYLGNVIYARVAEISSGIDDRLRSISQLLEYFSGTYYTDQQRGIAERALFRIQTELGELHEQLTNTLVMAPDLGRPVLVNH
jgi:hypothetical protein